MSYDQWKTASPYDDEPDVVDECQKMSKRLRDYVYVHAELSDITTEERILMEQCADTFDAAAEWITEDRDQDSIRMLRRVIDDIRLLKEGAS